MVLNGNATLNGTKLQLTDSGTYEAGSAWYNAPLNIQQFSTSFSFQLTPGTSPLADGSLSTIQASGTTALGPDGGGLGYGPTIPARPSHLPTRCTIAWRSNSISTTTKAKETIPPACTPMALLQLPRSLT